MIENNDLLSQLEHELGHTFGDRSYLTQALTHSSVPDKISYERLEFLGDRVLGLVIANWLLIAFPTESEGAIAKRFAALVCRDALLQVADSINLERYIKTVHNEKSFIIRGQDTLLSDSCEAIIAALFLDGGLSVASDFIHRYWHDQLTNRERPPQDAKSALQEWAQGRGLERPHYTINTIDGPDHSPIFTVQVTVSGLNTEITATGSSKKQAEQRAAELALNKLKS